VLIIIGLVCIALGWPFLGLALIVIGVGFGVAAR